MFPVFTQGISRFRTFVHASDFYWRIAPFFYLCTYLQEDSDRQSKEFLFKWSLDFHDMELSKDLQQLLILFNQFKQSFH